VSKGWDKEFDASVGLTFSLKAFEMYRKSGTLSAEIRSVPGVRGRCQAYLELIQGKVVACYLIDRQGERQQTPKERLMQLDEEKGPFNWVFRENAVPGSTTPLPALSGRLSSGPLPSSSPVLQRLVSHLDIRQLQAWPPQQQHYLNMIFLQVDGRRSIEEIKGEVPLSPQMVEEGLRILFQLRAVGL
jgi:hypothetical protein